MFLSGTRVLELDGGFGEFAGKMLADAGAEVIKVEPPEGTPSRNFGPVGPARSAQFEHYNTSKKSIVLDLDSKADQDAVRGLAVKSDVVIDGLGARFLDSRNLGWRSLSEVNECLIYCSITPFGLDGPWSGYRATDLTLLALGGVAAACGHDDGTPVAPSGGHARHLAGMAATMPILAALVERSITGRRQAAHLDVAALEAIAVSTEMAIPFWTYQGRRIERHTGRHAMPMLNPKWQHRCRDGKYMLALPLYIDDSRFAALLEWFDEFGMAEDLHDERFQRSTTREDEMFHVVDVIGRFCAAHDSEYIFREAQNRRLPWAPVNSGDELLADPHFNEERNAFVDVQDADGTVRKYPQLPYLLRFQSITPAPELGQDTGRILDGLDIAGGGCGRSRISS